MGSIPTSMASTGHHYNATHHHYYWQMIEFGIGSSTISAIFSYAFSCFPVIWTCFQLSFNWFHIEIGVDCQARLPIMNTSLLTLPCLSHFRSSIPSVTISSKWIPITDRWLTEVITSHQSSSPAVLLSIIAGQILLHCCCWPGRCSTCVFISIAMWRMVTGCSGNWFEISFSWSWSSKTVMCTK